MIRLIASRRIVVLTASISALLSIPVFANAQQQVNIPNGLISYKENPIVVLPLVICWHDGKKNLYIQTDASDPGVAAQQGVNYVPRLSNAINAPNGVVDDIYLITNSKETDQYNVIPSEPKPVGPNSTDPSYTPLWQVSKVTWVDGVQQTTLKSEAEVLSAKAAGLVTIDKTQIVLNCPILYTDAGGLLPKAIVALFNNYGDDHVYFNR